MVQRNPTHERRQYSAYVTDEYEPQLVRSSPQYLALLQSGWVEVGCEVTPIEEGQIVTLYLARDATARGDIAAHASHEARLPSSQRQMLKME